MSLQKNTGIFYNILTNSLAASITNAFVWFAVTYWVFLMTKSVLATSFIAGIFAVTNAISALFFGSIVDHNKKKLVMLGSSLFSFALYTIGSLIYAFAPQEAFARSSSVILWIFIVILMLGSIAGNLRNISLATCVTMLFPENHRDKANGLVGTMNGVAFSITSILSGVVIGFLGMKYALLFAIVFTAISIIHLITVDLPEKNLTFNKQHPKNIDVKGTIKAVASIPGLFALIFFTTFNNFLGGVFMSLMDAYGLSLVSVQTWGFLWGFLSLGFILGGFIIAKRGLGKNPLKTLFLTNIIIWLVCIFFTIQSSIVLTSIGIFLWILFAPFIEASEHTIIQKVVPFERQGRVFGFAQSVESAASPITTFMIGPIAQFIVIPFMTTGAGVKLIGPWFGVGPDRGIALVFTIAGMIGLIVTLIARKTKAYKILLPQVEKSEP